MEINVAPLHLHFQSSSPLTKSFKTRFSRISNNLSFGSSFTPLKLGFRSGHRISMAHSMSMGESYKRPLPPAVATTTTTTTTKERRPSSDDRVSVRPVYKATPPNRNLRTPHSGFHFDGSARNFFEGWYFRVSIPDRRQSFCFMYAVENPAFTKKLGPLEAALYGRRFTGVGAQILGADDKYICQYSGESVNFWGRSGILIYWLLGMSSSTQKIRHELILGNTFTAGKGFAPPKGEVPPQEFKNRVLEGFQVSPIWHQGFIRDNGRLENVRTVKTAHWEYSTRPVYGWGNVDSKQKSTAGWLAAFPIFEPHWQICMAGGLSTGWIEWDGDRFEFENAPSYSEKNWGAGFPRKWFWVQCNVFQGAKGEVALTAGGGLRKLSGLGDNYEEVAMVGVHFDGTFYEFVPWTSTVSWEIAPWGYWNMSAENEMYKLELETTTKDPGTPLRAPTIETGFSLACKDTCYGDLKLQIWERRYDGSKGKMILDVTSNMAAVEIGGGPWFNTWNGTSTSPELVRSTLRFPVDIGGFFDAVPILKPPGL